MAYCDFCPRRCAVDREKEIGYCGAGPLARVAHVMLHHWEEPCISGTRGAGTIFFSGCTLRCIFCQNIDISARQKGALYDSEALCALFFQLAKEGAHNINLVTPTPHLETICQALLLAKEKEFPLPIVYNTGAYDSLEGLRRLAGLVDIYLPDLKYAREKTAGAYSGASDYFMHAKNALAEMFRQVGNLRCNAQGLATRGMRIRHLVLPGNLEETRLVLHYLHSAFGPDIPLSLMRQYTPCVANLPAPLTRRLTAREYERALEYCLQLGFTNVLSQEADCAEKSFIPSFVSETIS